MGQKTNPKKEFTTDDLWKARNIQEFKYMAKIILEKDKTQIERINSIAHYLFTEATGKKLFWILYRVQEGFENLPPDKHAELLRRLFRKAGVTSKVSRFKRKPVYN